MNILDPRSYRPREGRSPFEGVETLARETQVPVNVLLAFAERAGARNPDEIQRVAQGMAAELAPQIRAGADVRQLIRQAAGDEADTFLARAREIGDQLYPEQMARARQARQEQTAQQSGNAGITDFARSLGGGVAEGVASVAEGAGALIDAPFSALRSGTYEPGLAARIGRGAGDFLRDRANDMRSGMSPQARRMVEQSTPGGDITRPSTWTMGEAPSITGYALLAADVLGSFLPVVLSGLVGRGGRVAMAVGGAQSAGAGADQAREIVREAFETQGEDGRSLLEAESPYFRQMLAEGMDPEEAFEATQDAASRIAALFTAPIGAFGGAATARIMRGALPGGVGATGGPLRQALTRGTMSALEEGIQEVAEGLAARYGTQVGTGMQVDMTADTFGDFILGALGGGVVGAGAGALRTREAGGDSADEPAPDAASEMLRLPPPTAAELARPAPERPPINVPPTGPEQSRDAPGINLPAGPASASAPPTGRPPERREFRPESPAAPAERQGEAEADQPILPPERTPVAPERSEVEDAQRRLEAVESAARTRGWDATLIQMRDQLRDIIVRNQRQDQGQLAKEGDRQREAAGVVARKDGTPFASEGALRLRLGKLGFSAGTTHRIEPRDGGFVAVPITQEGDADGGAAADGVLDGVAAVADVPAPQPGGQPPAGAEGPRTSGSGAEGGAGPVADRPRKRAGDLDGLADAAPAGERDAALTPPPAASPVPPVPVPADPRRRAQERNQFLDAAESRARSWDGFVGGRKLVVRGNRAILVMGRDRDQNPVLDLEGTDRDEIGVWLDGALRDADRRAPRQDRGGEVQLPQGQQTAQAAQIQPPAPAPQPKETTSEQQTEQRPDEGQGVQERRREEVEADLDARLGALRPGYERLTTAKGEPSTAQTRTTPDGYMVRRDTNRTVVTGPEGRVLFTGAHDAAEAQIDGAIAAARTRRQGPTDEETARARVASANERAPDGYSIKLDWQQKRLRVQTPGDSLVHVEAFAGLADLGDALRGARNVMLNRTSRKADQADKAPQPASGPVTERIRQIAEAENETVPPGYRIAYDAERGAMTLTGPKGAMMISAVGTEPGALKLAQDMSDRARMDAQPRPPSGAVGADGALPVQDARKANEGTPGVLEIRNMRTGKTTTVDTRPSQPEATKPEPASPFAAAGFTRSEKTGDWVLEGKRGERDGRWIIRAHPGDRFKVLRFTDQVGSMAVPAREIGIFDTAQAAIAAVQEDRGEAAQRSGSPANPGNPAPAAQESTEVETATEFTDALTGKGDAVARFADGRVYRLTFIGEGAWGVIVRKDGVILRVLGEAGQKLRREQAVALAVADAFPAAPESVPQGDPKMPAGLTLGSVKKMTKAEAARVPGDPDAAGGDWGAGDFHAVISRASPYAVFGGYGKTRADAIQDAIKRAQRKQQSDPEAPPEPTPAPNAGQETAPAPKPKKLKGLTDAENAELAALEAEFAKRIKNQLNTGLDPEMVGMAFRIGSLYVRAGRRRFRQLIDAMIERMGLTLEQAQPYARNAYNQIRDDLELAGEDVADMDTAQDVVAEIRKMRIEESKKPAEDTISEGTTEPEAQGDEQSAEADDRGGLAAPRPGQRDGAAPEAAGGADPNSGSGGEGGRGDEAADGNDQLDAGVVGSGAGVPQEAQAVRSGESPGNFVIPRDFPLGEGTDGQKIEANMAALRLVKRLDAENRYATPDEQAVLARYVGWGGLKRVFDPRETGKTNQWGRAQAELKNLVTREEYAAIRRSTENAHFTSRGVVSAMWGAMRRFGFDGGRALEPTVGSGNFLGLMPNSLAGKTEWYAAELDNVTGAIARHLYPDATVLVGRGFQDAPFAPGSMDVAIGNPPFGGDIISSPLHPEIPPMSIHNYIIAKTGLLLREGGIMGMVVTNRFMDLPNPYARSYLARNFDFIGAVRLPNTAFKANAGTEVTTDIVWFQKRAEGEPRGDLSWLDAGVALPGTDVTLNRYFAENPEMMLGRPGMDGTMRGSGAEFTLHDDGRYSEAALDQALAKLQAALPERTEALQNAVVEQETASDMAVGDFQMAPNGEVLLREIDATDGVPSYVTVTENTPWGPGAMEMLAIIQRLDQAQDAATKGTMDQRAAALEAVRVELERAGLITDKNTRKKTPPTGFGKALEPAVDALLEAITAKSPIFGRAQREALKSFRLELGKKALGPKKLDALKRMLDLRRQFIDQLRAEREDSPDIERMRARLRGAYNSFVKDHGFINAPKNAGLMQDRPGIEFGLEERYTPADAKKGVTEAAVPASILRKRLIAPYEAPGRADSAADGVMISMRERGRLDMAYIASLTGQDIAAVKAELTSGEKPLAFFDPRIEEYVIADEYLSGNLAEKIMDAERSGMPGNVRALRAALPPPKTKEQIVPSIRAQWLPPSVLEDFLAALGVRHSGVNISPTAGRIFIEGAMDGNLTPFGEQFRTERRRVSQILEAAITGKSIVVMDRTVDDRQVKNPQATEEANIAVQRMTEEFQKWAYLNPDRAQQIVDAFNEKVNVITERKFDGVSYLRTVGANPHITLRDSQKNGAWRMIQQARTLMHHVVGAGKTMTAITAIMERKRLGLSKKSLVVVPNHIVEQWGREFRELYPGANLLVADKKDFEASRRRRMFARIASGDYDAIVIGHSQLRQIENNPDETRAVMNEQIDALEKALEEAKASGESKRTAAQIQKQLDKLQEKLDTLNKSLQGDDIGITFADMGIDNVVVDEAHEFKNLEYATSGERLVGMNSPVGSQRAFDLYVKLRGVQARGGATHFLTGTPVSNSLVEIYTMMKYLGRDTLKSMGLEHFDAWSSTFIKDETRFEYTPAMTLKERRVIRGVVNAEALSRIYKSFADILMRPDVERIYAAQMEAQNRRDGTSLSTRFPTPRVKGGGRQLVMVPSGPLHEEFTQYLVMRAEGIARNNPKDYAGTDNMLWVLSDARKASIDIRTIDPTLGRLPNSKVVAIGDSVLSLYHRFEKDRGTQLVFADSSVPSSKAAKDLTPALIAGWKVAGLSEADAKARVESDKGKPALEQYEAITDEIERKLTEGEFNSKQQDRAEEWVDGEEAGDLRAMASTSDHGFSFYDDLKAYLIEQGVPATEVTFIHDHDTPQRKSDLHAAMNAGEMRVLIGSTFKMGAGMNVQKRIVAIHHADAPWRPSDMEQREGRGIRPGNELYKADPDGFELTINAYTMEKSADTVLWQVLERKATGIESFMRSTSDTVMEEGESDADSYAAFMAQSTGNQVFIDKMKAEKDLTAERAAISNVAMLAMEADGWLNSYPQRRKEAQESIRELTAAAKMEAYGAEAGQTYRDYDDAMLRFDAAKEAHELEVERVRAANEALPKGVKKALLPKFEMERPVIYPEGAKLDPWAAKVKEAIKAIGANGGLGREHVTIDARFALTLDGGGDGKGIEASLSYRGADGQNRKIYHLGATNAKAPLEARALMQAVRPETIKAALEGMARQDRARLSRMEDMKPEMEAKANAQPDYRRLRRLQDDVSRLTGLVRVAEVRAAQGRIGKPNRFAAMDNKGRDLRSESSENAPVYAGPENAGFNFDFEGKTFGAPWAAKGESIREDGETFGSLWAEMAASDGDRILVRFRSKEYGAKDTPAAGMVRVGDGPLHIKPESTHRIDRAAPAPRESRFMAGAIPAEGLRDVSAALGAEMRRAGLAGKVSVRLVRGLMDAAGVPIQGRQQGARIEVNPESGDGALGTLRHEIVHALRDAALWGEPYGLFTRGEWQGLVRSARADRALLSKVQDAYPDLGIRDQIEEVIAEQYRRWARNMDQRSGVERAFQKMRAFLQALANALRGQGFQSAALTFERIASGGIGARGPGGPAGAGRTAQSRKPADPRESIRQWNESLPRSVAGFVNLSEAPEAQRVLDAIAAAPDMAAAERAADRWVLARGKAEGLEHMVAFDQWGGVIAIGRGHESHVAFPPALLHALETGSAVYATHNHPRNSGFSPADLTHAIFYDVQATAMGHKGAVVSGRRGPIAAEWPVGAPYSPDRIGRAIADIHGAIKAMFDPMVKSGEMPVPTANAIFSHVVDMAMHRHQIADIRSNGHKIVESFGLDAEALLAQADGRIRDVLTRNGLPVAPVRDQDRDHAPGGTFRPDQGRAGASGVPARDGRAAERAGIPLGDTQGLNEGQPRSPDGRFASHAAKYSRQLLADDGPVTPKKERGIIGQILTDAMGGLSSRYNLLALVPSEPLLQELAKNLPSAQTYLRLKHAMSAMRNDRQAKAAGLVEKWRGAMVRAKGKNADMMALMHDATRAGVDPAEPFAPPPKKTWQTRAQYDALVAQKRETHAELAARWEKLPKALQGIYREVREAYREISTTETALVAENVKTAMEVTLKRARLKHADEMRRIDEDGLTGAERDAAIAKADAALDATEDAYGKGAASRLRSLRLMFEQGKVDEPYFPLMRYGNYYATVKDRAGKIVSFSRFETEREMMRAARELRADNPGMTVKTGLMRDKDGNRTEVDPNFVADVQEMLGAAAADTGLMDSIWQRYLETLPDFSIRKSRLHRKGTPGFSADAFRNFARQSFHSAHQLARLKYGMQMQMALDDAAREADAAPDPTRATAVVNEMGLRHQWVMNPQSAAWSTVATSAAFVYYLGATPAAALVNISQSVVVGIPVLSAAFKKGSIGGASRHMMRALRDFGMGKGSVAEAKNISPQEREAVLELERRGVISKTQSHDLAGVAESGMEYSDTRQRIMAPIAWMFHQAERLNREITGIAAYRMARENGLTHEDAIDKAALLTWKTHFNYEGDSRPRVQQDDFVRVMTVFKNYQLNMLYRLFRDTHQAFQGATEAERREARAQLIGITGMMMTMTGVSGTWGYALITTLLGLFVPGGADEIEEEVKTALVNTLGRDMAGLVLQGVPGTLTGINLSQRMGMPELWFRRPDRQQEGDELYQYWAEQVLGAVPGMVQNAFRGFSLAMGGEVWRGVETASPKAIRDLMRGYRYSQEGVTTLRGNPIIENVSPAEALTQALGFTPSRVSERYQTNRWMRNTEQRIVQRRRDIIRQIGDDVREGRGISAASRDALRAFNAEFPEYPITSDTIRQSLRSRARGERETIDGLRLNARLDQRIRGETAPMINQE